MTIKTCWRMRMGLFFRRLKGAAADALGLYELPQGNKRFVFTHFNFWLFTTIPGVFINTFFYRQDGKFSTVAIYTAICVFGSALFMMLSSYISIKKSPVFVMRIGVILFNVFYVALLLVQNRAVAFMPLLGLLNAIASSFYWQGYNTLLQDLTDSVTITKTLSVIGISTAVVSLIIPGLSGFVITRFKGSTGYMVIFAASFLVSLFTTYLTTRIPYLAHNIKSNLLHTYVKVFTTRSWRLMFLGEFARGIRDQAFPIFLSIVLFKLIEDETFLGFNTMACGLASIIAYYFAGKFIKESNRVKFVFASAVILLTLFLTLLLRVNATIIFIISIVNAMFTVGLCTPAQSVLYTMFDSLEGNINFTQIMAIHEVFFGFGRVIGLVIAIVLSVSGNMYAYAFLILNLTAILAAVLLKLAVSAQKHERKKVTVT
jgi:YQGE family putative transporter